jgi:hypothetical protein
MNRFNYEKLPDAVDFCGRKKETKILKAFMMDGKNVVIFGDRRYGKTSLIEHCHRELPKKGPLFAFADLFSCTSAMDVASEIYEAVYNALPFNLEQALKEFAKSFSRMTLEVKASGSGIKAVPRLNSRDFDELLSDALLGADKICAKLGKNMIIALDEFQQIAELDEPNLDAIFRQYMQRLKHISFVFSGSKKSMLSGLFIDKKKPLYNMASSIEVTGIDQVEFYQYCDDRLERTLPRQEFDRLYTIVRGQTKLVLQTCWWLNTVDSEDNPIPASEIDGTLNMLIDEKHEEFKLIYNNFTVLQRKTIKAIVGLNGEELFAANNLNAYEFSNKQQLLPQLKKLVDEGIVDKLEESKYQLNDVYFALWCYKNLVP